MAHNAVGGDGSSRQNERWKCESRGLRGEGRWPGLIEIRKAAAVEKRGRLPEQEGGGPGQRICNERLYTLKSNSSLYF